jgi:hypothetical protein
MVSGLTGVTDISGGAGYSIALSGGSVWAWGNNGSGQLGNGTLNQSSTPQKVNGLPTITAISAGAGHVLALAADGTVWTWGSNSNGLGSSNITQATTPIQIPGMNGVTAITAGYYFSAALRSDGTLWTWGSNGSGQLGDGTNVSSLANGNPWGMPMQSRFDTGLLTSISIVGVTDLPERSTSRYAVLATFDNGSTMQVPGTLSLAITSNASLTDNNLLSAFSVVDNQVVTLSATYTDGNITRTSTLPVTIKNYAAVPGAPTQVVATSAIGQASVSFAPPSDDGGSAISSYTVMASPSGITASGVASPITVSGLAYGVSYTYSVVATNAIGTGPTSLSSASVSTLSVPDAPTGVTASAGNSQATVSFSPPANGGREITSYTVTSMPAGGGDADAGSIATTHTILGLTNGTAYTFSVVAVNVIGPSSESPKSNAVTPAGVPSTPIGVIASASNGQASISFTASASSGGSSITSYTATSSPSGVTASGVSSPILVTSLNNGTAYTFTLSYLHSDQRRRQHALRAVSDQPGGRLHAATDRPPAGDRD